MSLLVLLMFSACAPTPPEPTPLGIAPPPGVGGVTLSAPGSFLSGGTIELSATAVDLVVGDRVDFGLATTTGAGVCPHRQQTGGAPCLDIAGQLDPLGSAYAADEGGAIVARLSAPWTSTWDQAYAQAFLFRGASSATSQVEVIDVVQPWEGHGPRIDTLEAQVADLQAQLDALRADVLAVDGDVGFILADYVTHGELPTAGGTFSGAERPADPPIGAIYVRPDGDVEVFDGFGWRSIGASTICGDGYLADGEACDDGNDVDTDACTSVCQPAACGDGFIQPGEACDDGNAVNTDACTGACELAACGDGFVQAGEACDDGNAVDTDACSNACQAQGALTVFVTSQAWTGSLGGVAGADAKCQAAAQAGGRSGTFVAFLSTSGLNAKDRVEDTEYRRFDGTVVAPDLAGLTTNNLSAAVLTDEFGAATPSDTFDTWTGTNYQGLWFGSSNDDCSGWSTAAGNGITGGSHRTEQVLWKAWNREACTNLRRLYCFEVYP